MDAIEQKPATRTEKDARYAAALREELRGYEAKLRAAVDEGNDVEQRRAQAGIRDVTAELAALDEGEDVPVKKAAGKKAAGKNAGEAVQEPEPEAE